MFVDYTKVYVKGGDGGNGSMAFRREKYVPKGGPAGGDGGHGASVIMVADPQLTTLMDFRYQSHYKAERGSNGEGSRKTGASAEDLLLKVPVGTLVRDVETQEVLADLSVPGEVYVAAKGGRGGRGNVRFRSNKLKAPAFAEKGEPGEEGWVVLELKLLADVGLVGYPNAGKSTLISRVSAARPKIADYPFTTLVPNLGVVGLGPEESFVIADIPGIIEGAHEGAGLGHRFLRHIERTRVLIYVLDCAQIDGRDVVTDFEILKRELAMHREDLAIRPAVLAANKLDLPGAEDNLSRLREAFSEFQIYPISAVTGEGLDTLMREVFHLVKIVPLPEPPPEERVVHRLKDEEPLMVEVVDGVYEVKGEKVDKLAAMTDLSNEDALPRFFQILNNQGLENQLREMGIKAGDTVVIGGFEFEYQD
ncbi:MAG: GTPase ObgE [Methylocystaceae bacterium]